MAQNGADPLSWGADGGRAAEVRGFRTEGCAVRWPTPIPSALGTCRTDRRGVQRQRAAFNEVKKKMKELGVVYSMQLPARLKVATPEGAQFFTTPGRLGHGYCVNHDQARLVGIREVAKLEPKGGNQWPRWGPHQEKRHNEND
ncbi:hypothetical protein NDU88_004509 [Pleurodeles waltl]|uniref:Uncharacterized protein n=1 Tax=Pleurodeles waltl TaxID=8319 RepID=A0AAV7WVQ3_PLEWA|nr:hypothetical protein NDU88_004509 [Pleurodeles waltl]